MPSDRGKRTLAKLQKIACDLDEVAVELLEPPTVAPPVSQEAIEAVNQGSGRLAASGAS